MKYQIVTKTKDGETFRSGKLDKKEADKMHWKMARGNKYKNVERVPVKEEIAGVNTTSVPGAGEDSSTVVMRRKGDRKNTRKRNVKILKRFMEVWKNKQKKY